MWLERWHDMRSVACTGPLLQNANTIIIILTSSSCNSVLIIPSHHNLADRYLEKFISPASTFVVSAIPYSSIPALVIYCTKYASSGLSDVSALPIHRDWLAVIQSPNIGLVFCLRLDVHLEEDGLERVTFFNTDQSPNDILSELLGSRGADFVTRLALLYVRAAVPFCT